MFNIIFSNKALIPNICRQFLIILVLLHSSRQLSFLLSLHTWWTKHAFTVVALSNMLSGEPNPRRALERCALSQSAPRCRRRPARWLVYSKITCTQARHLNVLKVVCFLCLSRVVAPRLFVLYKVRQKNMFAVVLPGRYCCLLHSIEVITFSSSNTS